MKRSPGYEQHNAEKYGVTPFPGEDVLRTFGFDSRSVQIERLITFVTHPSKPRKRQYQLIDWGSLFDSEPID